MVRGCDRRQRYAPDQYGTGVIGDHTIPAALGSVWSGAFPPAAAAAAQHLPGVLRNLEPTLNRYGYLAIAGLVMIEDFGVPLPGETVLILGAVYAGAGRLNIVLVALLAFLGAIAGDNI